MLALAEDARDGLAVPVGQRDRKAELALAVAADDRLLDGEAASRDTLLWVVLVWDSFSPTLTVAVLEMSSTTAASAETFTSKLSVPVAPAACSPSDQVRVRVAAS